MDSAELPIPELIMSFSPSFWEAMGVIVLGLLIMTLVLRHIVKKENNEESD